MNAVKEALGNGERESVLTEDIPKIFEFVLKNNYFEFNEIVKQQLSYIAIGAKLGPPYVCIFMENAQTDFLKSQITNQWSGFVILMTSFYLDSWREGVRAVS